MLIGAKLRTLRSLTADRYNAIRCNAAGDGCSLFTAANSPLALLQFLHQRPRAP